jgi:hypothetical protein
MGEMAEDRIYADRLSKTDVYVATGLGVAVVSVSNDRIGQFSLQHRCTARDVAADGDRLLVATDEDVLAGTDGAYEPMGFGPAVAVGRDDAGPVAAGSEGTVARYAEDEWVTLGEIEDPRAIAGNLLAGAAGVFRIDDGLDHVGLEDVRDVAVDGAPLAATGEGCYRLGPGWTRDIDGDFRMVAADTSRSVVMSGAEVRRASRAKW